MTFPFSRSLTLAIICFQPLEAQNNELTDAERKAGWKLLFDGSTTAGWRGYGKKDMPSGWQVVDGALTRVGPAGDIVAELVLIATSSSLSSGRSRRVATAGSFIGGVESSTPDWERPIYYSAPEMQVLDDAGSR